MFEVLFLVIGLIVGAIVGALVAASRVRSKNAAPEVLTAQKDAQIAALTENKNSSTEQIAYLRKIVQDMQAQEAARAEEKRKADLAQQGEQSKVLQALTPVQKNLGDLAAKVTQIEESRKQDSGTLAQQLKSLGEQQLRLSKETDALTGMLNNNKARGAWGEAQLRNIVESAGLLEHVDFDVQVSVSGSDQNTANESTVRPDMVIHLPGGKSIPIDSKVPFSDYMRACEISDTASPFELEQKKRLLENHAKAIRNHVQTLSDKKYWEAFETAPDFVIAFIPNESILQAALEVDPELFDYAFARKVALTSPVTLWAVLKSVAYAWQQQSLTADAKKLFELSRELYGRFSTLGSRAVALGSSISRSVKAYNDFATTLESRVLVSARKLQKIDEKKIEEVTQISPESADIHELTAAELTEESPHT
jgi:DNA recombination protein RmuC